MREALPAFGFLAALIVVPFFISVGTAWSILHFTDTGILVGGGTVTMAESTEKKVVQCPYVTSSGFIERVVDHKEYGYRGQRDCPWRINVSA